MAVEAPQGLADPLKARAHARLLALQRDSESKYASDPWAFMVHAVKTVDQASGSIRPFPAHPYLETLTREWQDNKLLLVPKSRRMFVTWFFVALHYWLLRYRPATTVAFISRKEGRSESEGSAELVARLKFIHDHLPPDLAPRSIEYKFCRFKFTDTHSEVIGIGQGPDQLRQLTVTAILADEFAFWEHSKDTYIAMRPTIEGGGRLTLVSSANPGFFEQLIRDAA